ncbi:MAG: autoinducer binding domain-containing protein [Thiolinea sp.]
MPIQDNVPGNLYARLSDADSLDMAFAVFAETVMGMGYEGVLYGCAPALFAYDPLFKSPVVRAAGLYSTELLLRYQDEGLAEHDFTVKAIKQGVRDEMDWWSYRHQNRLNPQEITLLDIAKSFGLHNGLSIPVMNNSAGIAGYSVASAKQRECFDQLNQTHLPALKECMHVFNAYVWAYQARDIYEQYTYPVISQLTAIEKAFLRHLPIEKSIPEIARQINRVPRQTERIASSVRRKFGGISTNQLIYYSGLLHFNDYI